MISTPMFEQFTLPYLKRACQEIEHTIYHLDGVNQLNHLDCLLQIEELDAVQWIYGYGQPSSRHWIEVYQKIANAQKGIFLIGDYEDIEIVSKQVFKGLYINGGTHDRQLGIEILKQYQVPL